MKHKICLFAIVILSACTVKTTHKTVNKIKFSNKVISDSLLAKIPSIKYSRFELNSNSNQKIEQRYIKLTQNQIDFFFTFKEQKKLNDFMEFKTYFLGKKQLSKDKQAIFLICDADYMGIYLYCAIINQTGKLIGKFNPAYLEVDADYSINGKGEFVNDSTYRFTEVDFQYIDDNHKKATQDSLIRIFHITPKQIQIMKETKFPTDTIREEENLIN
ncbi:hypothetical protein [Parabacteroides sp. FAFU027]|uniref:hypothetical protein n=1 Tax=Parabacteroides sp. FAFU027 TaxID=2922715 RepID=UPI001FAFE065|nr:hypothetical protein [Parabacteroides sp. FAFU027]